MTDNIFTNLYNKLLGFFHQVEEDENSKSVACNRLRVVLMQDRTNLTPQLLEQMRGELVELLSKYLEMDKDALELGLEQEGEQMALALTIPVIRAKSEEEIEEAKKKAEELKPEEVNEEKEETVDESSDDEIEEETEKTTNDEELKETNKTKKNKKKEEIKFPNKEICGECKECAFSDDIECEKKSIK